ncbi:hypothetical protein DM48_8126 [Burkholderia gladioli]|uniref:Uncharacterized protein n=1 Tax=Burkholderia gladioli TaxID=28095 RepID=A0AAW3FBP0_BURGA|nr:hypothetical protein DM48_8126 [Burkholderia gladioli]
MSGSRRFLAFLVDDGASMIVASTSVPSFIISPRSHSEVPISSNSLRVRSCSSSRPELQQRGRIRHGLDGQIYPGEGSHRDAVVQRILQPLSDRLYHCCRK